MDSEKSDQLKVREQVLEAWRQIDEERDLERNVLSKVLGAVDAGDPGTMRVAIIMKTNFFNKYVVNTEVLIKMEAPSSEADLGPALRGAVLECADDCMIDTISTLKQLVQECEGGEDGDE